MPLPSALAQQPVAGAAPVSSAPSGNPDLPAGAPAPLEPPLAAGASAGGQAQGARVGNAALVVGVAAAGATALALSAACVAALVLRARRRMNTLSDQQPPRAWPTTSAPMQALGPAPAAPAAPAEPASWGPCAQAPMLVQAAAQAGAAAAAAPHVLTPQQPAPAPATPLQGVSAEPGPRGKAGAGAAPAPAPAPSVAAPPAIRVPVYVRAGWLPRPDPNPGPCLNPDPSPHRLQQAGPCAAGARGAPREPPRTALGLLTDLRALDAGLLSRRSTWPLAARAAAPAPQSPDSPWRPGSAPWPSAQVSHVIACPVCLASPVHLARNDWPWPRRAACEGAACRAQRRCRQCGHSWAAEGQRTWLAGARRWRGAAPGSG